jgi:molybdenum cofactor cytidylyltransferase
MLMKRPGASNELMLGVVVLAAGRSERMGRPKLLLPWRGTSILGHLLAQWRDLGAEQVAVVRAANDPTLAPELERLAFPQAQLIDNPAPDRGMFSSIQAAARWTGWKTTLTHWAIVLGDQPHLRIATLRRLLEFTTAHPDQVCQPSRAGHGRHPVLLPRPAFSCLSNSRAADLKDFLATLPERVALCEMDDPGLDLDIDTPENYRMAVEADGDRC